MSSYSLAHMKKAQNLQVYNKANGAASLIRHPRGSTHTTGRCPVYCPLPTAMPSVRLPAVPRLPQTSSQLK
ncbi:hypothetical protein T05_15799 [Trichinella murrelli]|uniref:Uncharacterized protein n=1 Tax=Trichinella murrelli TaxID=144512 RepID=A0A0V0TUP3_9BILA|nr:hypothetical protein T05_15799 [Trichinella murrelli]